MFKRLLGVVVLFCALASPVAAQTVTKELPQSWWPPNSIMRWVPPTELAAIQACTSTYDVTSAKLAADAAMSVNSSSTYGVGGGEVDWPPGCFVFNGSIDQKFNVIERGVSSGVDGAGPSTIWQIKNTNTKGVIVHPATSADCSTTTTTTSGSGSTFINIAIKGGGGSADTTSHGFMACGTFKTQDVVIENFAGDGYHVDSGSICCADLFRIEGGYTLFIGRHAFFSFGGDSNAGLITGLNNFNIGGGCDVDESLLGDTFVGGSCQSTGTGLGRVNVSGASYQCISLTACPTTNPPTDATIWYPITFSASYPTWGSGGAYVEIGDFICHNVNAHCTFLGVYSEAGTDPLSDVRVPGFISPISPLGSTSYTNVCTPASGYSGFLGCRQGIGSLTQTAAGADNTVAWIGGEGSANTILGCKSIPANAVDTCRLRWVSGDIRLDWNAADSDTVLVCTGFATGQQFGTGAAQAYYCGFPRGVGIGDGTGATGAMRRFFICNGAAPTGTTIAYAVGDVCWNYAVTALGSVSCWVNVTAGSPGTWVACSVLGADVRQAATNHFTAAQQFDAVTNGKGLQAFNVTTTCTTAATVGAICTTGAESLPVAYADTNYRVSCTGLTPTAVPIVQTVTKSNSSFTITVAALTAVAAHFTSFDCIAAHN